jgi:hypothetical protein
MARRAEKDYNGFMPRRAKQFVYGLFYLIILGGVVGGIYFLFLKPTPSCFDGVQNEGEQGVDCGGPCGKSCLPSDIQQISPLGTVHVFTPTKGHATVLVQLENVNADLAAELFDYTITIRGADGSSTVAMVSGTSFAYADETKYLVVPNESVSDTPSTADISIGNIQWLDAAKMGLVPQFAFTNITSVAGADGYATVSGNITDRDASSFSNITIVAVFKDAAGMPIGASETELDSISPGVTQNFSISYPLLPNENISATEIKAYAERN